MPMRSPVLRFAVSALLVMVSWGGASAALAAARSDERPLPVTHAAGLVPVKTGDALAQRALAQSSSWRAFQSRFGAWRALWNEATGTPHRAFGPSIPLAGFANDAASVDQAVRAFIARQP